MSKVFFLISLFIFLFLTQTVFAQSSYVLPYPSAMPGSLFYKINLVKDDILKYWYFGDFGQFEYNLKESDKYLVEAKTLFEYQQYLLASNSLKKSDQYFIKVLPHLLEAQKNNKDISQSRVILKEASLKHIEVLEKLAKELPQTFIWRPEKEKPIIINIKEEINSSISVRERYL